MRRILVRKWGKRRLVFVQVDVVVVGVIVIVIVVLMMFVTGTAL